jgi:hypothetical protein
MARVTSISAYLSLKKSGRKVTQEQRIVDQLVVGYMGRKDYTLQELAQVLELGINAVSGRVNGLKKKGAVIERPRRKCTVTQHNVTPVTWAYSSGSPSWLGTG